MSDPTETVPDGPTADSGSREWTQRFLIFGFFERMRDCPDRVANHARLGNAFAHALAFLLISQILNEMSYFHCRTADHDPKSKVDFPHECRHRALPFRLFLSGVVERIFD